MRPLRLIDVAIPALALLLSQTGCSNILSSGTSAGAGIASAGIANAFTKSAAVATGIGLGVAAGANAGLQYAERVVHKAEQDRIAQDAGKLPPNVIGRWSATHRIPIEDGEHGEVVVVRDIGAPDFACKEIVFSVGYRRTERGAAAQLLHRHGVPRQRSVAVGECGAGDRALGLLAMRPSAPLALLAAGLLGGCKSIPVLAGIAAGAAAGGASSNPAVGFAVGVAVSATGSYVSSTGSAAPASTPSSRRSPMPPPQ